MTAFQRAQNLVAVTIDYETWHPIPAGKQIDWDRDIFAPAARLLEVGSQAQVKITLMVEMGEYFWLQRNLPEIAARMELQWIDALRAGHDVQLHLHPSWLPELGARFQDGQWFWDWSKSKATDYPGDLTAVVARCKSALESLLCPVESSYRVVCFRAGAYQAQPFKRLYDALMANGIFCDSSVYAGGVSRERGYNYSLAYSNHQPYFANAYDPQLKAPPAECGVVEIPVFTYSPDQRWFLDGSEGARCAARLLDYVDSQDRLSVAEAQAIRANRLKELSSTVYFRFKPLHRWLNRLIPREAAYFITNYRMEALTKHQYFVMIGHTKSDLELAAIQANFNKLKDDGRFQMITLSQMAAVAREDLRAGLERGTAEAEAAYQVKRECRAILGEARNEAQSFHLQELIPWDRKTLLDLGCGSGYWSDRISKRHPWMRVTGADCGVDFIRKAQTRFASDKVSFQIEDYGHLSFAQDSFDCIYADNSLEHAFDVDGTLSEAFRVLRWGGVLVAAIPSDARNPRSICENHTWKTAPHEVELRLQRAGFTDIEIQEIDVFKELGMPPYPPSNDRMMYVKAWKRQAPQLKRCRVLEAMQWVYENLSPERSSAGNDPIQILANGYAFCWGYAVVLGELLKREGFEVKWLTLIAKDHPRGSGAEFTDSHEVLLAYMDKQEMILDPMANTCIPHGIEELLKHPELAKAKASPDSRYQERRYFLYDTAAWYSRVCKYAVRSDVTSRVWTWKRNRWRSPQLVKELSTSS